MVLRTGYSVHFTDLRERKKEVVVAKRVILAAGTMNTLKLLFASSAEPGGLSPMPSLGRTFGGNGDLIGAWFKDFAQPPMFEAAPMLGASSWIGEMRPSSHWPDYPASTRCRCLVS